MSSNDKCTKCALKMSWIGLWDSLLLALFKGVIGLVTRSHALMASALYSFHDVISGAAVLVGLNVSVREPDDEHPYGHGNAEYIVSAFTSILIIGATIFLMVESSKIIFSGRHVTVHWAALGAALLSAIMNEAIYRYNTCAASQINSPAMLTHAKHHRADAISSLAVAIAIVMNRMGLLWADPLVAVFEAVHLIVLSVEILYHGGSGLMDKAIAESDVSLIREVAGSVNHVKAIQNIKTRQIGRNIWVDLYVHLSASKTVSESHEISERIREGLMRRMKHLGRINVIYV